MTASTLERRFVLLSALRWLPLGLVLPVFVLLPVSRGLDLAEIGLLSAVHGIVVVLCELPTGAIADAAGRKRTLLAGGVLMTGALAAFAVAQDLAAFAIAESLLAAGRAFISGSLEAWFVDAVRADDPTVGLRRALSRSSGASTGALAVGSLVGGAVPAVFGGGLGSLAVAGAGAAAVYVLAVIFLVHEPPRLTVAMGLRASLSDVARAAARYVRTSSLVRRLLIAAAMLGIALTAVETLWQPRLSDLLDGAGEDEVPLFGVLSAAAFGVSALAALAAPRVTRGTTGRRAYVVATVASAAAFVVLAGATGVALFVLAYVAVYAALGVIEPLHYEILHEAVDEKARATMVSVDSLGLQLGGIVGGLALPAIADASTIGTAWLVAAAALLVGAVAMVRS